METKVVTDKFVLGYLEAALLLMGDTDLGHSISECSPELLQEAQKDCCDFKREVGSMWTEVVDAVGYDDTSAGSDFWLTRNRHGTGFNDRDVLSENVRARLTAISKQFRTIDVYVGDDGQLYFG